MQSLDPLFPKMLRDYTRRSAPVIGVSKIMAEWTKQKDRSRASISVHCCYRAPPRRPAIAPSRNRSAFNLMKP